MVIICNHDSKNLKCQIPNNHLQNCQFFASSFIKTASSLRFSNNQDELLFDSNFLSTSILGLGKLETTFNLYTINQFFFNKV